MSLIAKYPFPKFRPHIGDALADAEQAFSDGKKFVMINAPTGCHAAGTKVIMFDGSTKEVENIVVGDTLMGPDSLPRKVLRLFSGRDDMYRISPIKGGREFVVNSQHILSLISTNEGFSKRVLGRNPKSKTGTEICNISVADYIKKSAYWKHLHKLYRVGIEFTQRDRGPTDPYLLGLLLGDGSLHRKVGITTIDHEIERVVYDTAIKYNLNLRVESKAKTECKSYFFSRGRNTLAKNKLADEMKSLGLYGTRSESKFIPHSYKTACRDDRLKLLAGLIDTDGSKSQNCFDYTTKSKKLSEDIAFLSRSLGLCASESTKVVGGVTYYRLNISGHIDEVPTILPRKRATERMQKKRPLVTGFSICPIGQGDFYGFMLDKDHLYLLDDFTVTHNSGKSGLAVAFARHFKSAVLTPTKMLQNQYAETKEFGTEYTVFGKSNYRCGLKSFKHLTVDQAICCSSAATKEYADMTEWEDALKKDKNPSQLLKTKCVNSGICEYYRLINDIPVKSSPVINYDLFFHLKKTPLNPKEGTDFGENIVFDEAHHLMSKARSVFGYKISGSQVEKLLGSDAARRDGESPGEWLARHVLISSELLKKDGDLKSAPEIYKFYINAAFISQFDIEDRSKFFIDDKGTEVEIKPVNFKYLKNIIFYPFKRILLLSATFPKNFCEIFNISEEEIEIIDIPSSFPKENRPLLFIKDLPGLNFKTELSDTHPTIISLKKILDGHGEEKGIIHCSNYSFFRQLQKIFRSDKRFIWVEQGQDKSKALAKHAASTSPTVLVSPAMLEGIDLKDDMARFQVMLKLPFPTLDDYTRRMMAIHSNYYDNEVATSIMQAYGRAVRSDEDYAIFYILDGAFAKFAGRKDLLSKYTLEAYRSIFNKDLDKLKDRKRIK